jgi:AraC-like DNA-binding protein
MEHARRAVQTGVLSAVAERCGFGSDQKLFRAMMAHFRHSVGLSERQLAILALMHGIELGSSSRSLPQDACTPEIRELLSKSLKRS